MKFAKLNQIQKDFYLFLETISSCVNVCVFDYSEESFVDYYSLSKIATERFFIDMPRFMKEVTGFNKFVYQENIEGQEALGQLISFEDFLGTNYDFFFNVQENKVRSYSLFGLGEGRVETSSGEILTHGLIYALINPPYGLGRSEKSKNIEFKCFLDANGEISIRQVSNDFLHYVLDTKFSDPHDNLIIYKWSDNWNIYFNSGKEWWGAFFWTVVNLSNKTIAVFAASTTD